MIEKFIFICYAVQFPHGNRESVEGPLKKPQIKGRSQTAVISFVVDVSSELKAHPLNLCVFVSVCVFLYTYSTMRVSNEPKVCPISM